MNILALSLGSLLFVFLMDRMRRINWLTTKTEYVSLYLAQSLWSLGIVLEALRGRIEMYQLGALIASLIWIHLTRTSWKENKDGPPGHVQSARGDLGPPEIGNRL